MTTRITGREWEDLSAYLDGQLSPKESARLEEKLRARADLRHALKDLSQTRTLLRSQSPVRAPRNFLLTPKMVGERQPPARSFRLFPVMRLASALAMALFILVLAGDLLSNGRQPGGMPVAFQSVQMPAPAAEMKAASEANAPQVGEAIEAPAEVPAEVPAPTEAPAEAQADVQVEVQAETQAQPKLAEGAAPAPAPTTAAAMLQDSGTGAELYPPPAEELAAGAAAAEQATPVPLPAEPTSPPLAQVAPAERNAVQSSAVTAPQAGTAWSGWRFIEISLALLAIFTAGWAFYLWRLRRS
jgi:anti-sigma factor RsiW